MAASSEAARTPDGPGVPPLLSLMVQQLAAAIPSRSRDTVRALLIGAAVTRSGHVTAAIWAAGSGRAWTAYFWFVDYARWSWLALCAALVGLLRQVFQPAVWSVIIDDTLVERRSQQAPGSLIHFNHARKPNRPRFLRGQGWICLAAVVERNFKVGAVPLLLRLVRAGAGGGRLVGARVLLRALGDRLGAVRLLLDSWYMRAPLVLDAVAAGHCVIGQVRRDTALYRPPPRATGRRRPRKYGARLRPEEVAGLPVRRTAQILYGNLEVVSYRSLEVIARFLGGRRVRGLGPAGASGPAERADRRATAAVHRPGVVGRRGGYRILKRWPTEPLFGALKHTWGLTDAWQRSRQALMRWVSVLCAGYALAQILAYADPRESGDLVRPPPWRPSGTVTDGLIQAGLERLLRTLGLPGLIVSVRGTPFFQA
jgi:DDE superfamily endonuclease